MRLIDADKLKISYDGHFIGVAKNDLDNAPTIDAEPIIHGHWILDKYDNACCSNCHREYSGKESYYKVSFCAYCGAKMDEESEADRE